MMMYKFKSEDSYRIEGRGVVHLVKAPHDYVRDECPFLHKAVMIDDEMVFVEGVESFAICPTKWNWPIGLLVK